MFSNDRLRFFSNMIRCCHNLYIWHYDSSFRLISSSCPEESSIGSFLKLDNVSGLILVHAKSNEDPLILTSSIRLMWTAAFEKQDDILQDIYILGPYFIDDNSPPEY